MKFLLASMSNCCGCFSTNPIDVIKVRMQLEGELRSDKAAKRYYDGFLNGMIRIFKDEGVAGLYRGLPAGLLRDASYSGFRLGAYDPVKGLVTSDAERRSGRLPLYKKILSGATTGAIGSALAVPTDLVKIQMQAQRPRTSTGPASQAPAAAAAGAEQTSTLGAFRRIYREGGVRALWKGTVPTVQRAALVTATQIPSYDHSKHLVLDLGLMEEGLPLHMLCSMFAGLMTAVVTSPVDVIKTRIMNQRGGEQLYSGVGDALVKTIQTEGVLGLYKGLLPNWMRLGPHTIVTFMVYEKLRSMAGFAPV